MAYSLKFLKSGGVIAEISGVFTPADHAEMQRGIYGPRPGKNRPVSFVIADYSKIKEGSHSVEDLKKLASYTRSVLTNNPDLVIALVTPDDWTFGLGRVWRVWLGESEGKSMIFRTRKEAEDWISARLGDQDLKFE